MNPALTTRSGWCSATALASAASQARPVGVVGDRAGERRHAGPLGAGQALDAGPVGPDGDDPRRVAGLGGGVEQRLQQRAGAGHQHHDPRGHRQLDPVGRARWRGHRSPP